MCSPVPYETPQIKTTLALGSESSVWNRALLLLFQHNQPSVFTDRKGKWSWHRICPAQGKGSHQLGPTSPQGNDSPSPLAQGEEWGNLGSKATAGHGCCGGAEGRQGEQDGHWQLCNRASGLKIPSASVPKTAIWRAHHLHEPVSSIHGL